MKVKFLIVVNKPRFTQYISDVKFNKNSTIHTQPISNQSWTSQLHYKELDQSLRLWQLLAQVLMIFIRFRYENRLVPYVQKEYPMNTLLKEVHAKFYFLKKWCYTPWFLKLKTIKELGKRLVFCRFSQFWSDQFQVEPVELRGLVFKTMLQTPKFTLITTSHMHNYIGHHKILSGGNPKEKI